MKSLRLPLLVLAVAALAACSKADKVAGARAPQQAASKASSAAKSKSVFDDAKLAPLAKALEASMHTVAGLGDVNELTAQDLAVYQAHERARLALLAGAPDAEGGAAAMREVLQHAFSGASPVTYSSNLLRLSAAAQQAQQAPAAGEQASAQ